MDWKETWHNRHRSLKGAAKTAVKLLLAQIKYVDIRDMPAYQNPQHRSAQLPGPRHAWQNPGIALICPNFSWAQRVFPRKLLGRLGYTIALRSAKCSCSSYSHRILNKSGKLAHVWHHQSSMEQLGCPCELISIGKVLSTRLGTERFSDQIYPSQKIFFSYFFFLFFSFISIYISSLHYLITSAHQKACLF